LRIRPFAWLRNTVRNRLKDGLIGKLLAPSASAITFERIRIVSATRMDEQTFWKSSALGRSLAIRRNDPRLQFHIAFENRVGLPKVYNSALAQAGPRDAILFVHDDLWLDDPRWLDKLQVALKRYDVVGLAGNRRRVPGQHAWLFTEVMGEQAMLDAPYLSGSVAHGQDRQNSRMSLFGPSPARCELVDGLFIALRNDVARDFGIQFDERFEFHFYDMDFCRTARAAGLSMGTWPITVVHQSVGKFSGEAWQKGLKIYRDKWRS
jgi:GT2 family glycosyltransferase